MGSTGQDVVTHETQEGHWAGRQVVWALQGGLQGHWLQSLVWKEVKFMLSEIQAQNSSWNFGVERSLL